MVTQSVNAEIKKAVECLRYSLSNVTLNFVQGLFILSIPAHGA